MRTTFFVALLSLLVLASNVSATSVCVNSSYAHITASNNGTVVWDELVYCADGCLSGRCTPNDNTQAPMALGVFFAVCAFALIYAGFKFSEEHGAFSWLFVILALAVMAVGLWIQINTGAYTSGTNIVLAVVGFAFVVVMFVLIGYFYLRFITKLRESMKKNKRNDIKAY